MPGDVQWPGGADTATGRDQDGFVKIIHTLVSELQFLAIGRFPGRLSIPGPPFQGFSLFFSPALACGPGCHRTAPVGVEHGLGSRCSDSDGYASGVRNKKKGRTGFSNPYGLDPLK